MSFPLPLPRRLSLPVRHEQMISLAAVVRVADTTTTPGARYRSDGPDSGEEYREEVLGPAFQRAFETGSTLLVDLDGTHGYATSFLEEAFGGLARIFGSEVVLRTLRFKCDDEPTLRDEIVGYIERTSALG